MAPTTRAIAGTSNNEEVHVGERLRLLEESLAQVTRAMQEMVKEGGWIFRCEQFFSIDDIPENQKVKLISMHLFDTTLLWHKQFIRLNGHKCVGQLFSLVLIPKEEDCFEDCLEDDNMEVVEEMPQISLHAMNGVQTYRTLRVKGTVVAKKLGWHIRSICPLAITVGDGYNVTTTSECKQFKWQLQGVNFCSDVMLLPLVGCEMILEIQWLSTLGDIKCNFKELRMKFMYKRKKMVLRGTPKSNSEWMTGHKLNKVDRQAKQPEFSAMQLCVYPSPEINLMKIEGITSDVQPELQQVVEEFADVFVIQRSYHQVDLVITEFHF
ncbi:hypothetical protein Tco_1068056 [Tanacetum coccineum]|uniref:Uncharacterized protein n=1 Tax=Tanacetum coccineum TaxID=301880 RepID=A0ABQ5HFZ3_9ASTR